jgi:hypothetical protein
MKTATTKVTETTTYITKLIAKVERTYRLDPWNGNRTIKVGEVVATYKGGYHAAPWGFEGFPAENFRTEKFLLTRKITTEVTVEPVE